MSYSGVRGLELTAHDEAQTAKRRYRFKPKGNQPLRNSANTIEEGRVQTRDDR